MKLKTDLKAGALILISQPGDTLASLARKAYGNDANPDDMIRIYEANKLVIGMDPCNVLAGAQIFAPDRPLPPQPIPPTPFPPVPPTPKPTPHKKPMPGECQEFWGNGVCLYKTCPYPPFQMPC